MKEGQRVKVIKKGGDPWIDVMDRYLSKTVTIQHETDAGNYKCTPIEPDVCGYIFPPESLEVIE